MQGRHKDKRRLSLALAELILVSLAETHNTLFYAPTASSQVGAAFKDLNELHVHPFLIWTFKLS